MNFPNINLDAPWNDVTKQNDLFAPWNDRIKRGDVTAPWNNPTSDKDETNRYMKDNNINDQNYLWK